MKLEESYSKDGVMIMSTKNKMLVRDVMLGIDEVPVVSERTLLKEALETMDKFKLGLVCIVQDEEFKGIMTDGDVRRLLTKIQKPFSALLGDDVIRYCVKDPTTIAAEAELGEAILLMGKKQVWDLPVLSGEKLIGALHLHPAIKAVMNYK